MKSALLGLSHIGIATDNPEALKKLLGLLGFSCGTETEEVKDQGVRVHFISMPVQSPRIELLEVVDPEGTVAKFVEKRGPGIHHLSFQIAKGQLEPLSVRLQAEGYRMIYPFPKIGAHQMRINFIHPGSAGGVLIELMEASEGKEA